MIVQTVITVGYLPKLLVLLDSLRAQSTPFEFSVLFTDASQQKIKELRAKLPPDIEILGCDDLNFAPLEKMRSYYSVLEFNAACKIIAIRHQLLTLKRKACLFLDGDMLATGDVIGYFKDSAGGVQLTPHSFAPYPDDNELPDDLEIIRAGHMNAGTIYFQATDKAFTALEWLTEKTICDWFIAPKIGMHAEQQWLSLMPYFFPNAVSLVQQRGINAGYWNLHERHLRRSATGMEVTTPVGAFPLLLFHFSGFDPEKSSSLTYHSGRQFPNSDKGVLKDLITDYRRRLTEKTAFIRESRLLSGDILFCQEPLHLRMAKAAAMHGRKDIQYELTPGLLQRIGRRLDALFGGR